ncbi:hypothetical protein EV363DRAFT_1366659 [Boletus edulis]|nr:hypothetical protein EV363DRAFT_1366659 [Boletus edulis]
MPVILSDIRVAHTHPDVFVHRWYARQSTSAPTSSNINVGWIILIVVGGITLMIGIIAKILRYAQIQRLARDASQPVVRDPGVRRGARVDFLRLGRSAAGRQENTEPLPAYSRTPPCGPDSSLPMTPTDGSPCADDNEGRTRTSGGAPDAGHAPQNNGATPNELPPPYSSP